MTVLDDFLISYLHCSVSQRLFEDTCRQLRDCKGSLDERKQIVDETLRLAMEVCDYMDNLESIIPETIEFIEKEKAEGIGDMIPLISNIIKEDRARANSYSNYVAGTRIGAKIRKPRKPQVANPFVPLVELETEEEPGTVVPDEEEIVVKEVEEEPVKESESTSEKEEENPLVTESKGIIKKIRKRK